MRLLFILFTLLCIPIDAQVYWPQVIEEIELQPEKHQLSPIYGGASNENYHLIIDESHYFLRKSPQTLESLYADPAVEYQVLDSVSRLGVSATPLYYDREKRILVSDFLLHDSEKIDLLDPAQRMSVLSMLRKVEHSGITISRVFEPYNDVMHLVEAAQSLDCDPLSEEFHAMLPKLQQIDNLLSKNPKKTLCHLDLHSKNVIRDQNRFWIVDWEYAAMSHPFLALASMASIERWDNEKMQALLSDYMQNPSKNDFYCLYLYRIVADLFWTAWNHVQDSYSSIDNPYADWEKLFFNAARDRLHSPLFQEAINAFKPHVVLLFGPPGSGKGTCAQHAKEMGYGHISAGDLLRDEINRRTELGLKIEELVKNGNYIDPTIMFELVKERAEEFASRNQPFIIDGYGRNTTDAANLRKLIQEIDAQASVLFLEASDNTCKERILSRLVCSNCFAIFNQRMGYEPNIICPACSKTPLQARLNDTPQVVEKRLKQYREEIEPCYRTFLRDWPSSTYNTDCELESCFSYYDSFFLDKDHSFSLALAA